MRGHNTNYLENSADTILTTRRLPLAQVPRRVNYVQHHNRFDAIYELDFISDDVKQTAHRFFVGSRNAARMTRREIL